MRIQYWPPVSIFRPRVSSQVFSRISRLAEQWQKQHHQWPTRAVVYHADGCVIAIAIEDDPRVCLLRPLGKCEAHKAQQPDLDVRLQHIVVQRSC